MPFEFEGGRHYPRVPDDRLAPLAALPAPAADEPGAVRGERHGGHRAGVAPQFDEYRSRPGVPHPYSPVAAAGDDPLAVRAEGDAIHVARVAFQIEKGRSLLRVPDGR